jgi:hypothetical protein
MLGLGKKIAEGIKLATDMGKQGKTPEQIGEALASSGWKATSAIKSTPVVVDVIAKKKTLTRGIGVTYSNIKTSSEGLLNSANVKNKTLLGE